MVIKQLTGDLTLSKLTGTAHGHLFHWTLINLLSPTSLNEKITRVYWRKKQHTQPDKPSAPPSSLPEFQWWEFRLHTIGFEHRTFLWSEDPEGSIPVHGDHPAPNPLLRTARNMQNKSAQPRVGKTLKLCKNNATLFWRYITCQKSQHTLKFGKH
jgi:hypothetical protein